MGVTVRFGTLAGVGQGEARGVTGRCEEEEMTFGTVEKAEFLDTLKDGEAFVTGVTTVENGEGIRFPVMLKSDPLPPNMEIGVEVTPRDGDVGAAGLFVVEQIDIGVGEFDCTGLGGFCCADTPGAAATIVLTVPEEQVLGTAAPCEGTAIG